MVLAGVVLAWWLDHRGAEYSCNARCNPILSYADDLRSALSHAKQRVSFLNEVLVRSLRDEGKSEPEIRKELQDDGVNWDILDQPRPYSFH